MALSNKQREILRFPYTKYDSIICDGAVRSGKTSIMALSFFLWAMGNFDGCAFAYCGKSVGSAERNIVTPLLGVTYLQQNFDIQYNRGEHVITARRGARINRFYLFGGRDASSYMLIQGITLAGVLLDEVALMPRSFVEQALLRCSVKGAKKWFNCNPDSSNHWFYKEWVLKAAERNALHLHFLLDDNPSLDEATKNWYKTSFRGIYYQRYVEGLWVAADGVIYDMFDATQNVYRKEDEPKGLKYSAQRYIGVDYGTINDMVYLDAYDDGETLWITREYRWASREKMQQKTDTEYADDFMDFMGQDPQLYCPAVVDPSAASFKEELQRRGVYVVDANNDVLDGIRRVATLMGQRRLKICETCEGLIGEISGYIWDEKASLNGVERPVKQNDHCLTGDTLVDTVDGPVPIRELVGKVGEVYCTDGHAVKTGVFHNVRMTQEQADVFEVELANGKKVKATADHPLLTQRGWVMLKDLRTDDRVACIGGIYGTSDLQQRREDCVF